jgi:glutathione peroxidase
MMAKISVKGDDIAPVYEWLTNKDEGGQFATEVSWNFQKFMIDENGNLAGMAVPRTSPLDKVITDWIEGIAPVPADGTGKSQ